MASSKEKRKKKDKDEEVDNDKTSLLKTTKSTKQMEDGADATKIDAAKIGNFIKRCLEKSPTGLRAEFQSMKRSNNWEVMKAFKAANEAGRNRYKDVGCLDASRVKLKTPPWTHEYIHGNYVATPSNPKRFICTQAPLEKTCADFWFMCLTERVEVIFMLCNLSEKGAKKCFEYYPTKEKETLSFEEGSNKITVKQLGSKWFKFGGKNITAKVKETTLIIEGLSEKPLKTYHYHWIDWPDRGVPSADTAIIQLLEKTRGSAYPIVVHCSAGIGRTGSVVMIEYILEQAKTAEVEDTDKILIKIREQRNNSVQTDHQYLFVHQVLLNYFKLRCALPEHVAKAQSKFTAEYEKLVA